MILTDVSAVAWRRKVASGREGREGVGEDPGRVEAVRLQHATGPSDRRRPGRSRLIRTEPACRFDGDEATNMRLSCLQSGSPTGAHRAALAARREGDTRRHGGTDGRREEKHVETPRKGRFLFASGRRARSVRILSTPVALTLFIELTGRFRQRPLRNSAKFIKTVVVRPRTRRSQVRFAVRP